MNGSSCSPLGRIHSLCGRVSVIGVILALVSCGGGGGGTLEENDSAEDVACVPDCNGKECGDDGCGGACGACGPDAPFQHMCNAGVCECLPDCEDRECGDDGCGGSCGSCDEGVGSCAEGECLYDCWTDTSTGLTWEASFIGKRYEWNEVDERCDALSLCSYDDWRVPNIGELRTLIRDCPTAESGSDTCHVGDNDCLASTCVGEGLCEHCPSFEGPAAEGCYWPEQIQGPCYWYWSSSLVEDEVSVAWCLGFDSGYVGSNHTFYSDAPVRCVR